MYFLNYYATKLGIYLISAKQNQIKIIFGVHLFNICEILRNFTLKTRNNNG